MKLIKILSLGLLAFGSVNLAAVPAHAKYKSSPFALAWDEMNAQLPLIRLPESASILFRADDAGQVLSDVAIQLIGVEGRGRTLQLVVAGGARVEVPYSSAARARSVYRSLASVFSIDLTACADSRFWESLEVEGNPDWARLQCWTSDETPLVSALND